jgi:dCMP deaminase
MNYPRREDRTMQHWSKTGPQLKYCQILDILRYCYNLAELSDDPSTKNGCLIKQSGVAQWAMGFNRLPNHAFARQEQWDDKPWKYANVVHAEVAAIYVAAKYGVSCDGATLYGTWVACFDCAKAIVESGIVRVIGHKHSAQYEHASWRKSIDKAKILFEVNHIEEHLGVSARFNGKDIIV